MCKTYSLIVIHFEHKYDVLGFIWPQNKNSQNFFDKKNQNSEMKHFGDTNIYMIHISVCILSKMILRKIKCI